MRNLKSVFIILITLLFAVIPENHLGFAKPSEQDLHQRMIPYPLQLQTKSPVEVKGVYVSNWMAASTQLDDLLALIERTELNAVVVDFKDDDGLLLYQSQNDLVRKYHQDYKPLIPNFEEWLKKVKGKNIYTIARIVTFKDSHFADLRPDQALNKKSGGLWRDRSQNAWLNPYDKNNWEYHAAIAEEAALLGFDEIQFDYVRFPENEKKVDKEVTYSNPNQLSKADAIAGFLDEVKRRLSIYPVFISADVFGLTTSSADDMGIGQDWSKISKLVDYICPMVYPSHYSAGSYGIQEPDLNPYAIVQQAMKDAQMKNKKIEADGEPAAIIRPWFQSFTATWIKPHQRYQLEQIEEQIKAAEQLGVNEYLLWNARSNYDVLTEKATEPNTIKGNKS